MLYLLDGQTKTAKWNGQPLFETVSATVEEELNGIFQLRLTYPLRIQVFMKPLEQTS